MTLPFIMHSSKNIKQNKFTNLCNIALKPASMIGKVDSR